MIERLLSGDFPRSRVLTVMLLVIVTGLAFAPFLFPGAKALNVAAKIVIFIILVASYDLLLGYTGIVSFAHTMFFGIGAYGVAIACVQMGPTWTSMAVGIGVALLLSTLLSFLIGMLSLRVRAIFYSMITLAVAFSFQTLASQLSELTGGEDGLNFSLPDVLSPAYKVIERPIFGVDIDGKIVTYYLVFFCAVILFFAMLRIVNSAFGRVLQAMRESAFRAEAIGYSPLVFRTSASMLSAIFATLAGTLLAIWLRYNGADTSLSFEIMIDILLIVVIGGMGTLYGAICGTTIFILTQSYLEDVMAHSSQVTQGVPLLSMILSPDRWLLWLGLLFILSVYYLPSGIVGKLRAIKR
jgi:branched-chain amino acid transport system permease protein